MTVAEAYAMDRGRATWIAMAWFAVLTLVNVMYYVSRLDQLGSTPVPNPDANGALILSVMNGLKRDFWLFESAIAIVSFAGLAWMMRSDKTGLQ